MQLIFKNFIHRKIRHGIYIKVIISISLLSSCKIKEYERDFSKPLKIVATTGFIKDAVENIVKGKGEVKVLMGPGVDPHLYKASLGDLESLTDADIILFNGLHLEGKMGEVLKKLDRVKPVIAVSQSIDKKDLIPTGEHTFDPHIWFDVQLWKKAVKQIEESLVEYDSVNAAFYIQNSKDYILKLDSLDNQIKTSIASIPHSQRVLITAHDAFSYFGKAYKIEVRGLQGISTLSEFGLYDVSALVDFIYDRRIKAVFVETSVSQKSINAVIQGCKARGHKVVIGGSLYSDALGEAGSSEGTYQGVLLANVKTIVQALK